MADAWDFRMPSLGADMTEGAIIEWRVGPGSVVHRGDIVALVDTDKAEIEVEIFEDATVADLLVGPGVRVPVGTPLARLTPSGAAAPVLAAPAPRPAPAFAAAAPRPAPSLAPTSPSPVVLSPLVRRLAEARHIDLAKLHGTGPGGLVQRADLELLLGEHERRPRVSPRARRLAHQHRVDVATLVASGGRPITGDDVLTTVAAAPRPGPPDETDRRQRRRHAIAALMSASWHEIPHYHVASRLDVSATMAWLTETNETRPVTQRLLPAALLLRATAVAVTRVPELNGWWIDDEFVPAPCVDLGVAVSLRGGGLLTPTLHAAESLSLDALMASLSDLVGRARRARLRASETSGASITVTNLGDLGADTVSGVIYRPQVALVGFGTIHEEAWAEQGSVTARPVVHASLAGDHRASDGLAGARLLATIAALLKEPASL